VIKIVFAMFLNGFQNEVEVDPFCGTRCLYFINIIVIKIVHVAFWNVRIKTILCQVY